jgi:HAD superfamily hydrolase (TIGR01509 family)
MRGTIRALIFDFDGLILDTEGPDLQAWQELYAAHGCALALDRWATLIGTGAGMPGAFDPYEELCTLAGQSFDREELRARRRPRFQELIAMEAVRPGVEQYLDDADRLGLGLAVASSSDRPWVEGHLQRLGLHHRFHALRCREDVPSVKPDPALYLAALAALGVRAEEAVAFEDSPNGVRAARAAGIFCVAIPNGVTKRLPLDHADLIIDSLGDRPLTDLLTAVAARAR